MDNPHDALQAAAERAREAEELLIETPIDDPGIVPKAHKVYQRAEEVDELARDVTADGGERATEATRKHGGPNSA